jgi:hypothetical protein
LSDFVVYKENIYMKKTKILVPAMGMLLLSTAASITGTVAWFAANASVTATGMQLKAKTDSEYLVISRDGAAATWAAGVSTKTVALSYPANAEVLPTSRYGTGSLSWVTANGTSNTDGTASETPTALTITEANNYGTASDKNYFVYDIVYVGLAQGSSAPSAKNLKCNVTFTAGQSSDLNKCLTVGVYAGTTIGTNAFTESYVLGSSATTPVEKTGSNNIYAGSSLSATAGQPIVVYAYFDGEDANCTTEKAINLANITIDLEFTLVG